MDPLSITASVVGLTATCVQTAKCLNDLKSKFQSASLTISAICTETTIISASLSQIQSSMLGSPGGLSDKLSARPDLEATLDQALTGCYVVFDVLQAEIQKLTESSQPDSTELGFRAKFRYLWSESNMQEILTQLRGLQTGLTLLLQLLGTDTMAELKQIMDNNTTVLSQVVQRTAHFRTARASHAPQSIFDMSFATQSIYCGDGGSAISSTLFSFDDEIVNSQAYRRALAKAYANSNDGSQTQGTVKDHEADPAADPMVSSVKQLLETEKTPRETPHQPVDTELDIQAMQLSDTPVLKPTPKDSLMSFMFEPHNQDEEWLTKWSLKHADIADVPRDEVIRQSVLHEIITSESRYLHSLQLLRYLYKYRLNLDLSMKQIAWSLPINAAGLGGPFPGCEDIYHANKTLLYDPLTRRESSEGPWLASYWDIFQNWLKQSADFYIKYSTLYPMVNYAVRKEAKQNARFSRFLDQSLEHRLSEKLSWDSYLKNPLSRIQRYCILLRSVFRRSDSSNPRHERDMLEQLIADMTDFVARCDVAVRQSLEKVETADLRSRIGDAGPQILPDGAEVQFRQTMLYKHRFRDMEEVVVLVVRKPSRFVAILRGVSRPKVIGEDSYEVFIRWEDHVCLSIEYARSKESPQRVVKMSQFNGASENSIMLVAPSPSAADEFGQAVLAIGGDISSLPT